MFSDLLHPELDRGKPSFDPTRFVADPEKARSSPCFPMSRCGSLVACAHFNADSTSHFRLNIGRFYRKMFLQEPWGDPGFTAA